MLTSDAHVCFKVVDCPFYGSPYLIEGTPFRGIALDAREHTEFHVFISISGPSLLGSATGFLTVTDPLPIYHMYFRAAPFDTVRASLFFCGTAALHGQGRVIRAGRVAILIEANFLRELSLRGL